MENGYDISLLKLDQYVSFTHEIQPACLTDNPNYPVLNSQVAIAGWGSTKDYFVIFPSLPSDLQNVIVKIADSTFNKGCDDNKYALIEKSILCLGCLDFFKHFLPYSIILIYLIKCFDTLRLFRFTS